jgi:hypothetical protein
VLIRNAFPDRPEPVTRLFTFWPTARTILARAPTVQATIATFADAGFSFHRLEQIPDQSAASLKEAYDRARVRADSLLRLLPDAEFFKAWRPWSKPRLLRRHLSRSSGASTFWRSRRRLDHHKSVK